MWEIFQVLNLIASNISAFVKLESLKSRQKFEIHKKSHKNKTYILAMKWGLKKRLKLSKYFQNHLKTIQIWPKTVLKIDN